MTEFYFTVVYINWVHISRNKWLGSFYRYKGNHISAIEIENVLQEHPDVSSCLVYGKEDPEVQELICAIVVLKENRSVTLKN